MSTVTTRVLAVERVDDLPVLFAALKRLRLAEWLDGHFRCHHLWKGDLTFGEVVCVWLTYLVSEGDHRLYRVQDWVAAHLRTLQSCLHKTVRALDCHDDRLADILDAFAQLPIWQSFEQDLSQHTVRVYHLPTALFRLDSTTASTYASVLSEYGLIQFGHSKDRDGCPQLKIAAAALDPLGMPVTTVVVPGSAADDPLYVPQIKTVQQVYGAGGKTYVGDTKMAALGTRVYLASTRDYYLCPLSEKQLSSQERLRLLQSVWQGEQPLQQVYRPSARPDEPAELVAEGFCFDVLLQAEIMDDDADAQAMDADKKVAKKRVKWTERRWLVRSLAFARGQEERLENRLRKASERIEGLTQHKQGKKRLNASELQEAAEQIIKEERVEEMLAWRVHTTVKERQVRGYGGRPGRVEQEEDQECK